MHNYDFWKINVVDFVTNDYITIHVNYTHLCFVHLLETIQRINIIAIHKIS